MLAVIAMFVASPRADEAPGPWIVTVVPPGITAGDRAELVVQGRDLSDATEARFDAEGLSTVSLKPVEGGVRLEVLADKTAALGFAELRLRGPRGWTNPAVVRVDDFPQIAEHEPNDSAGDANLIRLNSAIHGELSPLDADRFLVEGREGQTINLEVEARRLGTPLTPVLSLTTPEGRPLAQGVAVPGLEGDVRCQVAIPADGRYLVEVRDLLHRGMAGARYRLRAWEAGPTPIAGRATEEAEPAVVRAPPFTVVGRIAAPGESDRHQVRVKAGRPLTLRAEARSLGAWLDAVLTVQDASGREIAENDDAPSLLSPPDRLLSPYPDGRLDLTPDTDGVWTVQVRDRYDRGGPDYPYRLTVSPPYPDFAVHLMSLSVRGGAEPGPPLNATGAFNLPRGSESALAVRVVADGATGPVTVRLEGLPRGVSAAPVTIRPAPPPTSDRSPRPPAFATATGVVTIRVSPQAPTPPLDATARAVATALGPDGRTTRIGAASVRFGAIEAPPPSLPMTRARTGFPVAITGPAR